MMRNFLEVWRVGGLDKSLLKNGPLNLVNLMENQH